MAWKDEVGLNVVEWDENEAALRKTGMRDLQVSLGDLLVSSVEDVDVDASGRVGGVELRPTQVGFDALGECAEHSGGEIEVEFEAGVEKGRRVGIAVHGGGFVETGAEQRRRIGRPLKETTACLDEILAAIAEVGAQSEAVFHGRVISS